MGAAAACEQPQHVPILLLTGGHHAEHPLRKPASRRANASERALRHAVIWRKLSFGTQSAGGSRFVETMLTVIETCRQRRRNVFAFVTAAVEAHLAGQPPPPLLSGV